MRLLTDVVSLGSETATASRKRNAERRVSYKNYCYAVLKVTRVLRSHNVCLWLGFYSTTVHLNIVTLADIVRSIAGQPYESDAAFGKRNHSDPSPVMLNLRCTRTK
jgi:hypothetical protein